MSNSDDFFYFWVNCILYLITVQTKGILYVIKVSTLYMFADFRVHGPFGTYMSQKFLRRNGDFLCH